jgi:hypothetical protein
VTPRPGRCRSRDDVRRLPAGPTSTHRRDSTVCFVTCTLHAIAEAYFVLRLAIARGPAIDQGTGCRAQAGCCRCSPMCHPGLQFSHPCTSGWPIEAHNETVAVLLTAIRMCLAASVVQRGLSKAIATLSMRALCACITNCATTIQLPRGLADGPHHQLNLQPLAMLWKAFIVCCGRAWPAPVVCIAWQLLACNSCTALCRSPQGDKPTLRYRSG